MQSDRGQSGGAFGHEKRSNVGLGAPDSWRQPQSQQENELGQASYSKPGEHFSMVAAEGPGAVSLDSLKN